MKKKNTNYSSFIGIVLIVSVVSGALAGVISAVTTNNSINRYIESLSHELDLVRISEVKPDPVPGTYEESIARVKFSTWPSLAFFTEKKTNEDSLVLKDDIVGLGVIVTGDGWIVTNKSQINEKFKLNNEIWIKQRRYIPEKIVRDTLSDYVMIKVDATNLSAIPFGSTENMNGGEILFALRGYKDISSTSFATVKDYIGDSVQPAEVFQENWKLTNDLSGIVVNSRGELVGNAEQGSVTPLHHGIKFIQEVLRGKDVEYAGLGANVITIERMLSVDTDLLGNATFGALIVEGSNKTVVVKNGPAYKSELQKNDLIIAVDDVNIDSMNSLAEILLKYSPEDTAELTVLREGKKIKVTVIFQNSKDLKY